MIGAVIEGFKARKLPFRENVSTATLSTFRIGGVAACVAEPCCVGELVEAIRLCIGNGTPYAVIGRGSNILFGDDRIETVLIRTVRLDAVRLLPQGRIHALCGASLPAVSALAAREGLGGLAFACGIPGTVGGAVFMNAGAHGASVGDVLESVEIYDPTVDKIETLVHEKKSENYRFSEYQSKNSVILSATLHLRESEAPAEIWAEMKRLNERRRTTQPLEFPSAGSVFRRPAPHVPLSRILDELGLKGKRVGQAAVSQKHAGFIVNLGGATAREVQALILEIQNITEREKGFRPKTEIRFIP